MASFLVTGVSPKGERTGFVRRMYQWGEEIASRKPARCQAITLVFEPFFGFHYPTRGTKLPSKPGAGGKRDPKPRGIQACVSWQRSLALFWYYGPACGTSPAAGRQKGSGDR